MNCISPWWVSWRSKRSAIGIFPAAFAPQQAFCAAKPCRRRNSLPPRIEIHARGPHKMPRHFVGSAKAAGRAAYCFGGSAGGVIFPPQRKIYKRWPPGHLLACQKSLAEFAARRRQRNEIIFSRDMCVRENTARAASVEFVRHRRTNYARSRPQAFCRKNPEGFSTVAEVAARPPLFLGG